MKKRILPALLFTGLVTGSVFLLSWGAWGHQHINYAAVFALPEGMRGFYYNHIDFITEESVMPDVRKYVVNDKPEFARHFIDLETFKAGPADSLPLTMKDAAAKYDAAFLDKNGMLPWYMIEIVQKLTKAFREKKKAEILLLSADLGHYLGDANMPLHTSVNHNGQLTNQRGVHGFFEGQLPEQFGSSYNFYTGDAVYINDVQSEVWRIVMRSHRLADTLLLTEKKLNAGYDTSKIFMKDAAANILKNKYNDVVHTYEYAAAYHQALNGLVEKQLRLAVSATANFWYTAWVNAGSPDLSELDGPALTKQNRKNFEKDFKRWKKGEPAGFKTDREFDY